MDWILLGIPIGIVMLYFGSEWMVDGAKKMAIRLGITPFIVGLTVVAFGSSAPECITSIISASTPEIIIGNIVGSNIADVGLAIGLAALISPIACKYSAIRFEMIAMMISVFVVAIMSLNGVIELYEGIILIMALFIFVYLVYKLKKDDVEAQQSYVVETKVEKSVTPLWLSIIMVVVGLVVLYFGARFFIDGAVNLAGLIGISDLLVGLLVVAVGTSLPELCICIVAAYRKENDIVVSNIVGSVVFNSFFALGIGTLLVNVPISQSVLMFHIPVMILLCAVMFVMVRQKNTITRPMGVLLLGMYVAYVATMALVPSLCI